MKGVVKLAIHVQSRGAGVKSPSGETGRTSAPAMLKSVPEKTLPVSSKGPTNPSLEVSRVCAPHPDHSKPPVEAGDVLEQVPRSPKTLPLVGRGRKAWKTGFSVT